MNQKTVLEWIPLKCFKQTKHLGSMWLAELSPLDEAWPRKDKKKWIELADIVEEFCIDSLRNGYVSPDKLTQYWEAIAGISRALIYPDTKKGFCSTKKSDGRFGGFGKQIQDLLNKARENKHLRISQQAQFIYQVIVDEDDKYPEYFSVLVKKLLLEIKIKNYDSGKKLITELYRKYSILEIERSSHSMRLAKAYSKLEKNHTKQATTKDIVRKLICMLKERNFSLAINEKHIWDRVRLAVETNEHKKEFLLKNVGEYRKGRPITKPMG